MLTACWTMKMRENTGYEYSAKSVTVKEFPKICRTCLGEDDINPIFGTTIGDLDVVNLLEDCVLLKVNESDFLPLNICSTCMKDLYRIYEFKKQCHDNDSVLKLLVQNTDEESNKFSDDSRTCDITFKVEEEADRSDDSDDSDSFCYSDKDESVAQIKNVRVRRRVLGRRRSSTFKCKDCQMVYSSKEELLEHRKEAKHPEVRSHACELCNKMFTSSKLRQHMRSHTKEKPYKCDSCKQAFSMRGNLKRHMMIHTGERPHVCNQCGKGFIQATSLHSHEKTHLNSDLITDCNGEYQFTCNFCGRGFKRLTPFNMHLKKHTVERKIIKADADKSGSDESREHTCDICNRGYKTKHLLKAHQLTHGEKSFLCSDCGKGFVTKAALQSHLKVHTGEKPHTCVICKKSFAHVGSFDSHLLIHSGEKPYSCKYCPKSFTQLSHLTYHLRTHSGERPYSCSYCGKCFALKGNLTVHVRTHTGETPYLCTICGKGFYDSSSMKKHRRNHKDDGGAQNETQPLLAPSHHDYVKDDTEAPSRMLYQKVELQLPEPDDRLSTVHLQEPQMGLQHSYQMPFINPQINVS